jgi:hypothetical protein
MNNTITKLEYEKIDNVYSKAKYDNFDVTMNMKNGYINATKLCADGKKPMRNWIQNNGNKELLGYFEENIKRSTGITADLLIVVNTGVNELRGTYVHPDLIPHIASWVSPAFAYKVSKIVNNFLIREKEDEIRKLSGDKCELQEIVKRLDKRVEEADKRREEAEKEAKKMLQDMKDQNDRTHTKLDKAEIDNHKIKTTLNRVEARVEKIVEEVVPPTKQISLHEQFGIMKLNDKSGKYQYKVYCTQARNVGTAKYSILKAYPKAELFLEIKPNANAKNFLHKLKELYSRGDDAKIKLSYNYVNLVGNVNENELRDMVNGVVEHAKNFGNE